MDDKKRKVLYVLYTSKPTEAYDRAAMVYKTEKKGGEGIQFIRVLENHVFLGARIN